ncbi:hypothetical protein RIR_jg11496.t1 [Rhizophagus irregularis DAOM 181602=DAOM 197198]|nr:hypothetical protein RIR_jg11496.t1 [Rhizophagus irregularis DAOM 181602=DAOM 197198]
MFDGDSISSINFQFIEENLSNIIKSQKNLENISFNFDSLHLYNSLNSPNGREPHLSLSRILAIAWGYLMTLTQTKLQEEERSLLL